MSMYGMGGMGGMGGGMDPTMMMASVCCVMMVCVCIALFFMQSKKTSEAAALQQARMAAAAAASAASTSTEPAVPIGGPVLSTGDADWDIAKDASKTTTSPDPTKAGKKTKKPNVTKAAKKGTKKPKVPVRTPAGASTMKRLNATTIRQTWSDGTVRDWKVTV